MRKPFLAFTLIFLLLMVYGGGIPEYQNTYFYIGYFSVPILLSFCLTLIYYQALKLFKSKI